MKNNNTKLEYINYEISTFFEESPLLLKKLEDLDRKKQEIKELRNKKGPLEKPIIITLSGTPRAGKTTCIDNLFEFFKKADLKTSYLEEPAGLIYQKLKNKEEKRLLLLDRVGFVEQQYEIGEKYIKDSITENDIVLCDRGILDTFIWYDMYYELGMIDNTKYREFLLRLKQTTAYYNYFYALFTNSYESMKRDYLSSLSIEPRTTMNQNNIDKYNKSLLKIFPLIETKIDFTRLIDTTKCDKMDSSIVIANDCLDKVKKLYLER